MSSIISAIGLATPQYRFQQGQILNFMTDAHQMSSNDASRLRKIYENSGIDHRHSVLADFGSVRGNYEFFGNEDGLSPFPTTHKRGLAYEEWALPLGQAAVADLMHKAPRLVLEAITHLITVSCTGMYAPGLDIDLVEELGLSKSTERTCINFMGCYGAFNALKIADYICMAQPKAKVLIVDLELCTLHFQRENILENWLSNSLFGDGAAAVLVENSLNRSTAKGFALRSFYNELVMEAKEEMAWRIGDTGYEMRLSSHIAKNIKSKICGVTEKLVKRAGITLNKISRLAIHPGGRRILEVCEEALSFPQCAIRQSYDVLSQYGNMSSATILFVLHNLLADTTMGENTLSFAFGPGLTFESMIIETI